MTGHHHSTVRTCTASAAHGVSHAPAPLQARTTPVPPSVDAARRLLAAALDSERPADRAHDVDRFVVAEALAVLDDVTPPYPPVTPEPGHVAASDARREALAHLETALDEVSSVRDLTRIGLAAIVLRRGGGVVV